MILRHTDGPEMVPGSLLGGVIAVLGVYSIFVVVRLAVNVYFSFLYLYSVARKTDHPLDIVLARVVRKNEDDHVIVLGLADGDYRFPYEREFNTVYEFIDENMVPDQ